MPDLFNKPMPISDALKQLQARGLLPTNLYSAELKALNAQLLRLSAFSARTTMADLLQLYKDLVADLVAPKVEQRADRVTPENPQGNVTTGINPAEARVRIQQFLKQVGYQAEPGTEGTILDLSSFPRVMLKLLTDVATSFGAGRFIRQNADPLVVDAYPGLSLERVALPKGGEKAERDWPDRWLAAAAAAGDDVAADVFNTTGEMIALKSSGIWQALGDGAGGYDDTLGNPYDPLAFNTHMRMFEVPRAKMEKLGFLDAGEKAEPSPLDWKSLFKIPDEVAA